MLDYRYETFLALCQEESYTTTAEKLFITQPAVSQHIKWLETTYQCKLVSYKHRQISLTPKGQSLYDSLVKLKAQTKRIEAALLAADSAPPKINFAVTLSIADDLLPNILVRLAQEKPDLQVSCVVENTQRILARLREGSLDFALVEGNFPKEEFAAKLLATQPFIAVVNQDSPLQTTTDYQLAELLHMPLITREPGSGSRNLLENLLLEQNYTLRDFRQVLEIGSLNSAKALLQENLGLAFLYQGVVKQELAAGQLKRLRIQNMSLNHSFYFIYLRDSLFEKELLSEFELILAYL